MGSLLRTRLIEDLRIRNYSERTVEIYVRCVSEFSKHFGQSPEALGEGEIREYQRDLVEERKASWAFFNQSVEYRGSIATFREGSSVETTDDSPNDVWSGSSDNGSAELESWRYRQPTDGDSDSSR